jgi:hypothetical protein
MLDDKSASRCVARAGMTLGTEIEAMRRRR